MSNKTSASKQESKTSDDSCGGLKNNSNTDFFEACSSFIIYKHQLPERYEFDYAIGSMILSVVPTSHTFFNFRVRAPLNSSDIVVECPTLYDKRWESVYSPQDGVTVITRFYERDIGRHTLTFRSGGVSSSIDVLMVYPDLTKYTSFKLDGFDVGELDMLLHYNEFHTLEFYSSELDGFEFVVSRKIDRISYPANSPYDIDVVQDGELVVNDSGESSIEGFSSTKNMGGVVLRMRYKDPAIPYFGPVALTLSFKEGVMILPPVEVVKRVEV